MQRDPIASPGNENLKRILDYLKISYWLTDLNYVLLDVNETFLELAGASRKNLIGRDMRTLISAEELAIVKNYNNLLTEGKESVQFELYVYGPQHKKKIPVLYHLSMNTDEQGRPVTVFNSSFLFKRPDAGKGKKGPPEHPVRYSGLRVDL